MELTSKEMAAPESQTADTNADSSLSSNKIDLLDRVAEYETADQGDTGGDDTGEQDILKSLFDKGGVHSALKHDAIVSSNSRESHLIEKEANLVASRAVAALKESRQRIRREQKKTHMIAPTWTGRSGSTGAPGSSRPRFGQSAVPSSASILSQLKERNLEAGGNSGISGDKQEQLVEKIRKFLSKSPGKRATTKDIVGAFSLKISRDDVAIFRQMLKGIADFDKERKIWTLKEEFV